MNSVIKLAVVITLLSPVGLFAEDCEVSCCKAPTVVNYSKPEIPADMLKSGETAEIVLRCAIDEKGQLIGVKTLSTSHDKLEAVVLAAVQHWTFDASLEKGEPQRATVNIPFKFTVASK
ncbi:MAG: TonB family protein [Verrucomicrobia bacterium]|nr:TonB family protein [Verrucomicrobiota bacterium]MDA1066548.1 TonB family protein [Verrucomicrobiota bacterium]